MNTTMDPAGFAAGRPPRQQQRIARRRRAALLAPLLLAVCLIWRLCFKGESATCVDVASRPAATASQVAAAEPPSATFTCPDGRRGLHVVHTRFLLGQSNSSATFVAARVLLMNTFFVTSLNAQTAQSFVLYVTYDAGLPTAAERALQRTLLRLRMPLVARSTTVWGRVNNEAALAYNSLVPLLEHHGVLDAGGADFDLFITSRMDMDDAVHVGAIASVQRLACSSGASQPGAVQVVYIKPGLLWLPAAERSVYGITTTVPGFMPFLAIMQSMVKAAPLVRCPLNVYSVQHTQPWLLHDLGRNSSCRFDFQRRRDLHVWEPPEGQLGSLYVRTSGSSTSGKDKLYGRHGRSADAAALALSFGVDATSLMVANLFFSGLQAEAAHLLEAKNAVGNKFR